MTALSTHIRFINEELHTLTPCLPDAHRGRMLLARQHLELVADRVESLEQQQWAPERTHPPDPASCPGQFAAHEMPRLGGEAVHAYLQ